MTVSRHFVNGDVAFVVHQRKDRDGTVTFTRRSQREPVVELTLGSEVQTLLLAEFIHIWLPMIEVRLQADIPYLDLLNECRARTKKKRIRGN